MRRRLNSGILFVWYFLLVMLMFSVLVYSWVFVSAWLLTYAHWGRELSLISGLLIVGVIGAFIGGLLV